MTENKTPVKPPVEEKPDWIINSLQGKLPATLGELHESNATANQFSISNADEYWGIDSVKEAFTDEEGVVHRDKFDEYYVKTANEFRTNLESEYLTYKNENQFFSDSARKLENTIKKPTVIEGMGDLTGRSFNSNMPDEDKYGSPQFGVRENAINNYVQLDNGTTTTVDNYLDANGNGFTDDFGKMLKFAKDENGQYKVGGNGRPYLIPVEPGEKLKTYDEVYNGFNDLFGRYGVGDGAWAGVTSSLIAIPKGGVNFFANAIDGLAVLGQTIAEPLAGKDSALNKLFVNTQNTMKGTKIATTDKGLNDWTSYEAVVDMGVGVAFQLLGLVTGTGALRAIGVGAKSASRMSRLGMSTMSAAPIYDVGKESGLSMAEASTLYGIGLAGFYGLAGADDILVNAIMGKNAAVSTAMLKEVAQDALKLSVKGVNLTKGGLKAFAYNFPNMLRNTLRVTSQSKLGGVAGSTIVEAGQETSEQIFDTLLRLSFNQYRELQDGGANSKVKGGKFTIDWDAEIEGWKQAAVGGALGGAIAGGPMRHFMGKNNEPNDMLADFTRAIIDGKEGDILSMIDRMEAQDMFAEGFLTSDGNITGDPSESKNAEAAKIFREQVNSLVKLRDSSAMQDFTTNRIADMKSKLTGFDKTLNAIGIGAKENAKDAQTSILQLVGGIFDPKVETDTFYNNYTTAGRDAASLILNIDTLKAKKLAIDNVEEASEVQDLIDKAEEKLFKLKKGEFTDEYLTQGIYNIRALTNVSEFSIISKAINGRSFVNLNNNYASQSKNAVSKYETDFENQQLANESATEDNFEGASQDKINSLIDDNVKQFEDATKAIINKSGEGSGIDIDALIEDIDNGLIGGDLDFTAEINEYDRINERLNNLRSVTGGTKLEVLTDDKRRELELNTLLNMTQDVDKRIGLQELDESTTENIFNLYDKEVAVYNASQENGDSYTNVEALTNIQNSLEKRLAHINNIAELQGLPTVPTLSKEETDALFSNAFAVLGEINKLQTIAAENLNNPEGAINENALNLLNDKLNTIINIGNRLGEDEKFTEITNVISNHIGDLTEAHENNDIPEYLAALHNFEQELYEIANSNSELQPSDILNHLNLSVNDIFSKDSEKVITDVEYNIYKTNYDYLSGILNVSSKNLYTAYHNIIRESNQESISPSIEQRIIILDAARSAMNGNYDPLFPWDLNLAETNIDAFADKLSDAVYIDGGGGTGKTSIVMTAVAATVAKLNGKGDVFFTSVKGGGRIQNLNAQAREFGGISISDNTKAYTLEEVLANTKLLDSINTIVFDEATLISTEKFKEYTHAIREYNSGKTDNRIKVIYGGDSYQNNIGTIETSRESGINNSMKMLIPKSSRLDFSFRSQNQDLKALSSVMQTGQLQFGIPKKNIVFNNDKNTGVKIIHNQGKFKTEVLKFIKNLKDGESQKTVYITNNAANLDSEIVNSGITILTSQEAQGQEWDNVIVDMEEFPYKEDSYNYKAKQEYYTAVTRPRKFLLMSLPEGQQMSSQKGKVYEINPARLENATKENEITLIEEIVKDMDGNVSQIITEPTTVNKDVTKLTNPISTSKEISNAGKLEQTLNEFFKNFNEGSIKMHTFFTNVNKGESIEKIFDLKRKLLYGNYDDVTKNYGYRIVLAQIGSPEYTNVVRNQPSFDGNYALFLEGYSKNSQEGEATKAIIGVLGGSKDAPNFNQELAKLVEDNDLFAENNTVKSMELSRSIFNPSDVTAGFRNGKSKVSIAELKKNSPGINFGKVKILAKSVFSNARSRSGRAGQAFIPASFSLTSEQIDTKLASFNGDVSKLIREGDVVLVYVDGKNNSYQDIYDELETFLEEYPTGPNGSTEQLFPRREGSKGYYISKGSFSYATPLGAAYAALIGRQAIGGSIAGESNFNRALQQVYEDNKNANNPEYVKFLKKWADAAVEDNNIQNAYAQKKTVSNNRDSTRPYFLFRDYVEAKVNGKSETILFEKLLTDIQQVKVVSSRKSADGSKSSKSVPLFKNGFEYNFLANKNSNSSEFLDSVGAESDLTINNSETVQANHISQPSINLNLEGLVQSLLSTSPINQPINITSNGNMDDDTTDKDKETNGATQEPLQDVDISGDGDEITFVEPIDVNVINEEFEFNKGTVLDDFQKIYYPGSNANRMQNGIDQFKRNIWNHIFHLTGDKPVMATDISEAINSFRKTINSKKLIGNDSNEALLTDKNEMHWHDAVAASAFDFLMDYSFSTFKVIKSKDGTVRYIPKVTSYKAKSYDDVGKSLLDNTANEMVKTMLFNTKEMYIKNGIVYEKGNFLSQNDIEDAIGIFRDNLTRSEITAAMKSHVSNLNGAEVNPAILSMYYQFYSKESYNLGGGDIQSHSLTAIDNSEIPNKMVEAFTAFMRTASVYKYSHVDVNNTSSTVKGRPKPNGQKPNLLRQIALDSIIENSTELKNRLTKDTKLNVIKLTTLNGEVIEVHPDVALSTHELTTIFTEIGLSRFTEKVLTELKRSRDENPIAIDETLANTAFNILNKTIDGGNLTLEDKNDFFRSILTKDFNDYIITPISKNDGILNELTYVNLNGDKVNRLRDRTPLNSINLTIDNFKNLPASVYSNNLFVDGTLEIVDIVSKDGFKYFNKGYSNSKNHKSFLPSESAEYDIVWSFFDSLKALKDDAGTYSHAMFSPLVYSDGSTDLIPMVKLSREQISNPKSILKSLFESRKESYSKIKKLVDSKKYPIRDMNSNSIYQENIKRYVNGTYSDFEKYIKVELDTLKDNLSPEIKNKISTGIDSLGLTDSDAVIESFYYNWLAVSGEFSDLTVGKIDNFKGKTHSDKYIDLTKRAKMQVSNRSGFIFRDNDWAQKMADFKLANPNTPLPQRMLDEGMKLSKSGKVAYVDDVVKELSTLDMSRMNGKQEVLDGATFTNSLTRIFQRASSGGDFGTKIPTVSKPITTSIDYVSGVATGIKNAEFELTAEILRNGTPIVHNMMNNMLGDIKPLLFEIVTTRNETELGEDAILNEITDENLYSNIIQEDFENLAIKVVQEGLQDEIIHEIIPKSSRKYGKTMSSNINDVKYSTDILDFTNKGQQLDASHDVVNGTSDLTMISQFLNAISTNNKNPLDLMHIHAAIGEMIQIELDNWSGDTDVKNKLSTLVKDAINKRVGVSYQHSLVNKTEFSFNDKQIFKTVHSQLNSKLTENGIKIKLFGGQYVLHPQSAIIGLSRDNNGKVYLNNEVPSDVEIIKENKNIDLAWASPTHANGQKLEEYEPYIKLRDVYIADVNNGKGGKKRLHEFQNAVDKLFDSGNWLPGTGEMLIPLSLGKQFNITEEDLNIPINDYDAKFFTAKILTNPKNKLTVAEAKLRGKAQAEDFQKALNMLNVRIPTTGKHSGVVLKAVGFVNGSDNSVFVPPMLLYVQGADHDIDKGNLAGLQAIDGIIPMLDVTLEPDEKTTQWFPNGLNAKQRKIALLNTISAGMMNISANPKNAVEGNGAVDSLLDDMKKLLKPEDKAVHNKDSYVSFNNLRSDNQAGKALVGVFANAQKAYLTLDGYGALTMQNMHLPSKEGLDRTSEIFAALINAATDNAKAQILGPLGIDITNASMVSFMVMKGMTLSNIVNVLQENKSDFDKIRNASHYASDPFDEKSLDNVEILKIYRGGKELSLISKSILNTKLPNSAHEAFNYEFKINHAVSKVLATPFNFSNFINGTPENAKEFIAKYEAKIIDGKANFNILSILNPHENIHATSAYVKLYKQSRQIINKEIPLVKLVNEITQKYGTKADKASIQDTTYEGVTNYVYGIAISDFLGGSKILKGEDSILNTEDDIFDLSDAIGRSKWVGYFNDTIITELKDKYKGNIFIDSLRPIPIDKYNYPKASVTYGLPDLRNVEPSKILMYDVAFNQEANPNDEGGLLLEKDDKLKLLIYNLITTGGKAGKGSFAQLFKHDEPMIEAFNKYLDRFIKYDFNIDNLVKGFNASENNERAQAAEILPNSLPYDNIRSSEIDNRDSQNTLTLARDNSPDDVLSGQKTAMSLTDKQLNGSKMLSGAVKAANKGVSSRRIKMRGRTSSGEVILTYHGKTDSKIPANKFINDYPYKAGNHLFTMDIVGLVKVSRFSPIKPATYKFNDKGDVNEAHKKQIMKHVNSLIIENDADKASIYLENFGLNSGLLYNQIRLRLLKAMPTMNQYYLGFGDFAKSELKKSFNKPSTIQTISQIKENILEKVTSRNDIKKLNTSQRNELIANLKSYKSQDELDFYLTKLYTGFNKLSNVDENLLLGEAKIWYVKNRTELKNLPKQDSTKDVIKKKVELKGNGRAKISLTQIGSLIRSYEGVDVTNKTVIERILPRFTANIRKSDATKVAKKLRSLDIDVSMINKFLGTKLKLKGEDGIKRVKRIDTLIDKEDSFRFANIINEFGYKIEIDDKISFYDTSKDTGESIIDILEMVAKDNSFDDADKYFAEKLINQYESTKRYISDDEINDISKVCGK